MNMSCLNQDHYSQHLSLTTVFRASYLTTTFRYFFLTMWYVQIKPRLNHTLTTPPNMQTEPIILELCSMLVPLKSVPTILNYDSIIGQSLVGDYRRYLQVAHNISLGLRYTVIIITVCVNSIKAVKKQLMEIVYDLDCHRSSLSTYILTE